MRIKLICTVMTAVIAAFSVQATTLPAPTWHMMTFIDGSTKELRLMGSQHMFWYQDHDGHLYIQDPDNQWYFAKYVMNDNGVGTVISTGVLASSGAEVPIESNIKNLKIDPIHVNESFDSPAANHKRFTPRQRQRSSLSSTS
ncbi:hypothetical protein AB4439_26615, partial [Vibrio sp. 10N.261.46.C10]